MYRGQRHPAQAGAVLQVAREGLLIVGAVCAVHKIRIAVFMVLDLEHVKPNFVFAYLDLARKVLYSRVASAAIPITIAVAKATWAAVRKNRES